MLYLKDYTNQKQKEAFFKLQKYYSTVSRETHKDKVAQSEYADII